MSTSAAITNPTSALAIHGGTPAVTDTHEDMFRWPIVTTEDETAVLEVLRAGKMSGLEVTKQYEAEFAAWHGVKFALAHNNGTASLHAAMWACGVGAGDEVIGPSFTYWASVLPALNLGASVVFADIDPRSLTIDPKDIEKRITPRTKAIVAVHYCGHPCDMDPIMALARKHGIKVIEDNSHAQGSRYKGRLTGTLGDVAGISLMSGKSLACGEGGMLLTDNAEIYERAVAFGHYERTGGASRYTAPTSTLNSIELQKFAGVPLGGFKYRMHQLSSAFGRVQLKHYAERSAEIRRAMARFWALLEGTPGIRPHRIDTPESHMGGYYSPLAHYVPEELHGTSVETFCEALRAEGVPCYPGANAPLHSHLVFHEADIYHDGRATNLTPTHFGDLPVTEAIPRRCFGVPWFKHDDAAIIAQYAEGIRKVASKYSLK